MVYSTNPFKNQSLDAMNSAREGSEVGDLAGDGCYNHFMIRQQFPDFKRAGTTWD